MTTSRFQLPAGAINGFDPANPVAEPPATPVKVLYVLSAGRSGSTLVDRILGQYSPLCAVGEVYAVWEVGVRHDTYCGCGARFRQCPLWTAVFDRAFGGIDQVDGALMEDYWRRNDQMFGDHFRSLLTRGGRLGLRASSDGAGVLEALYVALAAESGRPYVVDTSKSVFHPYFMIGSPYVDPYVIHLVRDPHGVAYSWSKPKAEPVYGAGNLTDVSPVAKTALWWDAFNLSASRLRNDLPGRYLRMRYEDFAAAPAAHVRAIGEFVGLDLDPDLVLGDAAPPIVGTHSVWGNPMRFQEGRLTVRTDERWRTEMPSAQRRLVTALTAPSARAYGYR